MSDRRLTAKILCCNISGGANHSRAFVNPKPGVERGLRGVIFSFAELIDAIKWDEDRTLHAYLETTIDGLDSLLDRAEVGAFDRKKLIENMEIIRSHISSRH